MSNFICPTCGFNNIDCGKQGYKTDKEIKLEKQLKIAVEALEEVVRTVDEGFTNCYRCGYEMDCKDCWCGHDAQNALDKIKELDK